MSDPRLAALAGAVSQVEGAASWLARLATRAAAVGGAAALVLWWATMGDRVDDWWRGTAASLLVLALCLAASAWLLNVRSAMRDLIELPDTLRGMSRRRTASLRSGPPPDRAGGGVVGAVGAVRGILGEYGDVIGSWATVAQLLVPSFWLFTLAALVAVPVIVVLAAVAGVVRS